MAKTFRQTVEEVQADAHCTLELCKQYQHLCIPCKTNCVCEAVLKMAEGMQPMVLEAEVDYLAGYTDCWNNCQDYLRKQVE